MGIRSCVYAAYFGATALLFLLVTGFQWGGMLPTLPDCKMSCGVAVIQPLLLIGTPNTPCDTTDQNKQYNNNCFLCGTAGVEWPCPPISGAPGCMAGSTRIAQTCVGQPDAETAAGLPIVSPKAPDLDQCAAEMGTSVTDDVCDQCIAAGKCVNGGTFEGAGSYTEVCVLCIAECGLGDSQLGGSIRAVDQMYNITSCYGDLAFVCMSVLQGGVKYLCFTTPPRISLRPAMIAVV